MLCGSAGIFTKRNGMPLNGVRQIWRVALVAYGVLSLSSMAGMSIGSGLFACATLWFLVVAWQKGGRETLREVFSTPYSWFSLALFLACLISLLAAIAFPVVGTQEGPKLLSLKKFHFFLIPPLVAAGFLGTSDRLEEHPFWKGWALTGAIMGIVAMLQFFGRDLFPEEWLNSRFFRSAGTTGRFHGQGLMFFHLSFASCMCFVASTTWARVVFPRRMDSMRTRVFYGTAAALASLGVFFSYSRISFFALAIVVLALGFLRKPVWGLIVFLFIAIAGIGVWQSSDSFRQRFTQNQSGNLQRIWMWESAWAMFEMRPLTGVGFSRTGEISPWIMKNKIKDYAGFTSHAHNNFLDMLGATGAIGFSAFLLWWGFLFWVLAKAFQRAPPEERWLPVAAFVSFLSFHINGITQVNFWDAKSEHTLMIWVGVVLAMWIREKRKAAAS